MSYNFQTRIKAAAALVNASQVPDEHALYALCKQVMPEFIKWLYEADEGTYMDIIDPNTNGVISRVITDDVCRQVPLYILIEYIAACFAASSVKELRLIHENGTVVNGKGKPVLNEREFATKLAKKINTMSPEELAKIRPELKDTKAVFKDLLHKTHAQAYIQTAFVLAVRIFCESLRLSRGRIPSFFYTCPAWKKVAPMFGDNLEAFGSAMAKMLGRSSITITSPFLAEHNGKKVTMTVCGHPFTGLPKYNNLEGLRSRITSGPTIYDDVLTAFATSFAEVVEILAKAAQTEGYIGGSPVKPTSNVDYRDSDSWKNSVRDNQSMARRNLRSKNFF